MVVLHLVTATQAATDPRNRIRYLVVVESEDCQLANNCIVEPVGGNCHRSPNPYPVRPIIAYLIMIRTSASNNPPEGVLGLRID
jgi:hypothetical protein